jgi:GMP synthase PP-ATPase subunit
MEERVMDHRTPADEDPVVDGYLTALGRPAPSPGLANRVLVNVWQPKPRWLRRAEARYDELVESGRIWFIIGAFAAGSLIPITVATVGMVAWGDQIAWGYGEIVSSVWGALVSAWNAAIAEASALWHTLMPSGDVLKIAALVISITTVICSVGLYRMMRLGATARP